MQLGILQKHPILGVKNTKKMVHDYEASENNLPIKYIESNKYKTKKNLDKKIISWKYKTENMEKDEEYNSIATQMMKIICNQKKNDNWKLGKIMEAIEHQMKQVTEVDKLAMQMIKEANGHLLNMFEQYCQDNGCGAEYKYNHQYLSASENTQSYLIRYKLIKESECSIKINK